MVATFSGISVRAVSLEVFGLLTAPALTEAQQERTCQKARKHFSHHKIPPV